MRNEPLEGSLARMRTLRTLAVFALLALAAGAGVLYAGLADVAATSPHWAATRFVLHTAMERAVERQAGSIAVPALGEGRVAVGAAAYDGMCAGCHGAPGADAAVFAQGLNPEPPELADEAEEWGPAELFWITKHGIRMTGMPAFGPTHSDDEIWSIVAFLGRLPELDAAAYRALVRGAPAAGRDHGTHSH